jgi:dihydrofolate reductase
MQVIMSFKLRYLFFTDKAPRKHPKETDKLSFTFVTYGIESTFRQAKKIAGHKDVEIIGSASTTQQCIKAGLLDELQLERIKVAELPASRTHLRFRLLL